MRHKAYSAAHTVAYAAGNLAGLSLSQSIGASKSPDSNEKTPETSLRFFSTFGFTERKPWHTYRGATKCCPKKQTHGDWQSLGRTYPEVQQDT